MANHLAKFVLLSTAVHPLYKLLETKSDWLWGPAKLTTIKMRELLLVTLGVSTFYVR